MRYLITGGPGSGTTFMTSLMKALGGDVGEDVFADNIRNLAGLPVGALEYRPLLELCLSWGVHFMPVLRHGESRLNRNLIGLLAADDADIAQRVQGDVARVAAGMPDVVKCPPMMRWLNLWLLAGGPKPQHVFIMVRDTLDQALSIQRDDLPQSTTLADRLDIQANYGFLLETVMRHHVTFTLAPFPQCASEPHTLIAALCIKGAAEQVEFTRVWRGVADAGNIKAQDISAYRAEVALESPFPQGRLMVAEMARGVVVEDSDDGTETTFSIPPLHLA